MEVTIGVQNTSRELVIEVSQSSDEVVAAVSAALGKVGVLDLTDEKGRRVVVPASSLAYVDIGAPTERRVGFGAI